MTGSHCQRRRPAKLCAEALMRQALSRASRMVHFGRNEGHRLARSTGGEQFVAGDFATADAHNGNIISHHSGAGSREQFPQALPQQRAQQSPQKRPPQQTRQQSDQAYQKA
jgi:hypothetical protein